ncbi:hypothetical protein ACFL2T_05920 [Elusimicrobiota bacterium]
MTTTGSKAGWIPKLLFLLVAIGGGGWVFWVDMNLPRLDPPNRNVPEMMEHADASTKAELALRKTEQRRQDMLHRTALKPEDPSWLMTLIAAEKTQRVPDSVVRALKHSLAESEAKLAALPAGDPKTPQKRFYALADIAKTAFRAGQNEKAAKYASELLALAPKFKDNWNHGNAVHQGNIVLGRIALRAGDADKARKHLLLAADTTGSPQLSSFGPSMSLAAELLERGERASVLRYFELCSKFWTDDKGRLAKWTAETQKGSTPKFGPNLVF